MVKWSYERPDFLPDYGDVMFFIGKRGERKVSFEEAFRWLCGCWNDYYDNVEKLTDYLRTLPNYRFNVKVLHSVSSSSEVDRDKKGNLDLYDSPENRYKKGFKQEIKHRFGVTLDYFFFWQHPYDEEKGKIIRMPWLGADTYEEALGLGFDESHGYGIYEAADNKPCQIVIETLDSEIPYDVYERMKKHCIGAVYYGK